MYFKLPRLAAIIASLAIVLEHFRRSHHHQSGCQHPTLSNSNSHSAIPLLYHPQKTHTLYWDLIGSRPQRISTSSTARTYHPDVAVGPDATPDEREKASLDFAQIKDAYEDLKARQDEEEIEVVMTGGNFATGKRDRMMKYKSSRKKYEKTIIIGSTMIEFSNCERRII